MVEYASKVFATPFAADAVLREERQDATSFLDGEPPKLFAPSGGAIEAFAEGRFASSDELLRAASELRLDGELPDNDCHATGWLARKIPSKRELQLGLKAIHDSFFGGKPETAALYPAAEPPTGRNTYASSATARTARARARC